MDIHVALMTDDERLATPRRHHLHPQRLVRSSLPFQILERANVMHLDPVPAAAQFALVREESLHDLRRVGEPKRNESIVKRGVDVPCERNATPLSDQWRLAFACDPDFESGLPCAIFIENLGAIAPVHLRHTDAEFGRQCPRERVLHDSVKMGHVAKVVRHPIEVRRCPGTRSDTGSRCRSPTGESVQCDAPGLRASCMAGISPE